MTIRSGPSTWVAHRPAVASDATLLEFDAGEDEAVAVEPAGCLVDPPGRQGTADALATALVMDLQVLQEGRGPGPIIRTDLAEERRRHPDQPISSLGLGHDADDLGVLGKQRLIDVDAITSGEPECLGRRLRPQQRIHRRSIGRRHAPQAVGGRHSPRSLTPRRSRD